MKAGENSFSVDVGKQIPQHSKKSARGCRPGDGNQAEPISTSQPHRLCTRLQVTPAHSTTYGTQQGSLQQEHHELFSIQRMQTHRKPHLIWAVRCLFFFFPPRRSKPVNFQDNLYVTNATQSKASNVRNVYLQLLSRTHQNHDASPQHELLLEDGGKKLEEKGKEEFNQLCEFQYASL